jgi:hypothetical protein
MQGGGESNIFYRAMHPDGMQERPSGIILSRGMFLYRVIFVPRHCEGAA